MRYSDEDIRLNGRILQKMVHQVVDSAAKILKVRFCRSSVELVPIAGEVSVTSLRGQQIVFRWTHEDASGAPETIELAIGHTGPEAFPVITFVGPMSETMSVVLRDQDWSEFPKVRDALIASVERFSTR